MIKIAISNNKEDIPDILKSKLLRIPILLPSFFMIPPLIIRKITNFLILIYYRHKTYNYFHNFLILFYLLTQISFFICLQALDKLPQNYYTFKTGSRLELLKNSTIQASAGCICRMQTGFAGKQQEDLL